MKDLHYKWYQSSIMEIDTNLKELFVHYINWPTRWDEWIAFPDKNRIGESSFVSFGTCFDAPELFETVFTPV